MRRIPLKRPLKERRTEPAPRLPHVSSGYNGCALLPSYRTYLHFALAILVAAFVSFHPYLDAAGLCGSGGCPKPSHSSHATHVGFSTTCLAAVLVASGAAVFALASSLGRRRVAEHRRPVEPYLSPDTPPPRVLSSR